MKTDSKRINHVRLVINDEEEKKLLEILNKKNLETRSRTIRFLINNFGEKK